MNEPTLCRISKGQDIILPETEPRRIADATDVFPGRIDSFFRKMGAGGAAPETPVVVYELARDATLKQMFESVNEESSVLKLEQSQITEFCERHPEWLHPGGYTTLFLFEENGKLFDADVSVDVNGRLGVYCGPFEGGEVWRAVDRYRVVVPQR